jgi:ankyrin repeat protein
MSNKNPDKLLSAAGRGDVDAVSALLRDGADVNAQNNIGHTPLMAAARSYRAPVVKARLSYL